MTNKPSEARDTYKALLRGDITPAQAQKRAEAWYSAHFKKTAGNPSGRGKER